MNITRHCWESCENQFVGRRKFSCSGTLICQIPVLLSFAQFAPSLFISQPSFAQIELVLSYLLHCTQYCCSSVCLGILLHHSFFSPSYLRKILPSQAFRCCSSPGDLSILKLPKQKLNSPPFTSTSTCRQFYPVTSQVVPVEQGFSWANLRKIVKFNFLSSDTTFEFLFLPCQRSLGLFLVFLTIGGYRQAA